MTQPIATPTVDQSVVPYRLVSDLHVARPWIFWTDMLTTAVVGWTAFAVALAASPLSITGVTAALASALALYRGLCFIHEIAHLQREILPGFETAWNLLFGVPLLLPSFTYVGVHQDHHSLATYGTAADPEYLPFANSRAMIIGFAIQSSLLIPVLLLIRFLVLAPVGLLSPRAHRWLEAYASSFSMNPAYRRTVPAPTARKMRRWEMVALAVWLSVFAMIAAGMLPARILAEWYGVLTLACFVNTLRVLGAHEYEADGNARDRDAQLRDSIDTPGGPWTELWAPDGLRYHALHHYFAGIPYHNLGTAYDRIVHDLALDSRYTESTSRSLWQSLKALYAKAVGRRAARPWSTPPVHEALRDR